MCTFISTSAGLVEHALASGHHHDDRRLARPDHRRHRFRRSLQHRQDAAGRRSLADEFRLPRARQFASRAAAGRADSRPACMGLKLHEDWGSMPAAIDTCLRVADEHDFQVQIHTDTLNESGFVEDTLDAIGGRTIHMYHTEGAGGGHAPDIIRVAGEMQLPAVVDQSDQSLHGQHVRRTSRHDDGVPSPESGDSGGRGVRRKPHPRDRPSRPRTCCTTSARSRCSAPTARAWAASTR